MNPILLQLIQQYFPSLVTSIVEKYNGTNFPLPYYYRQHLRPEFSIDGKWSSLSVNNTRVAADIVAMDSDIALKKRPSMGMATGDIPKMGMKLRLNEKELTDLYSLVARLQFNGSAQESQIVARLFRDTDSVIGGGYERIEAMFLEGLSTGTTIVHDSETVGTGIRLDYGYLAQNAFTSSVPWATIATAKPLTDLQKLMDRARSNGDVITTLMMDAPTFNNMAGSAEGKNLYAASIGFAGANPPTATFDNFNQALQRNRLPQIELIERSVILQKNGVNTPTIPWAAGRVVAVTTPQIGTLAYARLAEQDAPVNGVDYQLADNFMLVSKYRQHEPSLSEVTKMQARVVPVINNVQSIYTLDSTITAA